MVSLAETGQDTDTNSPLYRLTARSAHNGDIVWNAPLESAVGASSRAQMALGADTLQMLVGPGNGSTGRGRLYAFTIT